MKIKKSINLHGSLFLFEGIILQVFIFSIGLFLAYNFWDAKNANLVIGTIWHVLVVVFCVISFLQNLVIQQKLKSYLSWFISIFFYLLLSIFFYFPSWHYLVINFFSALVVLIPIFLKSYSSIFIKL